MVNVKGIQKRFTTDQGDVKAISDVSFEVKSGEFFTLLGPSGCGKSTTIRCIAGLEKPDAGEITIGEKLVFSAERKSFVPAHQRDISMVFQSYAIWPNMTVFQNAAYPLEGKLPKRTVRERVMEVLKLVDIEHLADRPAPQLSGGQQQRVALARAIVKGAKVLLLDEPLSNLDAKLRAHMRTEIRDLQKRLSITAIYVTHDQEEALSLSDRIAIMKEGRIVEIGEPAALYSRPTNVFSAESVGACNLFRGMILRKGEEGIVVDTDLGNIECSSSNAVNGSVVICVRPEHIRLSTERGTEPLAPNTFEGTVVSASFLGKFTDCTVRIHSNIIKVQVPSLEKIKTGDKVILYLPPQACTALTE